MSYHKEFKQILLMVLKEIIDQKKQLMNTRRLSDCCSSNIII